MMAKRGSDSTSTYALQGKSLAEILKEIEKKGPKDPSDGKRYAGLCTGKMTLQIGKDDFAFVTTPDKAPVEVKASLDGGSFTSSTTTMLPKLVADKNLSPTALKEWNRFRIATVKHEDGHADSYFELAKTLCSEAIALSAIGTGKDEKTAKINAQNALLKVLATTFGGSTLPDRIKDDAKDYDKRTKHGESQGALLKASIV